MIIFRRQSRVWSLSWRAVVARAAGGGLTRTRCCGRGLRLPAVTTLNTQVPTSCSMVKPGFDKLNPVSLADGESKPQKYTIVVQFHK